MVATSGVRRNSFSLQCVDEPWKNLKDQAISKSSWKNGNATSSQEHVLKKSFYYIRKVHLYPHLGILSNCCNTYSTVRDSMEDALRTSTSYHISCLRQQPSGVDRRCQIWPIRGYTRYWYTAMSFLKLISQAFPRPLPQLHSFSPALSLAIFFACALLSECLEQASISINWS